MRNAARFWVLSGLVVAGWACAGTPGPGDAGYAFNLSGVYGGEVVLEGQAFSFEMDVRTRAGGAFEGTYSVTSPVSMGGPVTGTIVADSASFSLSYVNPMDGCGGTMDATGTVEAGGDALSGRARVNDSCGGYLSGTFSMKR